MHAIYKARLNKPHLFCTIPFGTKKLPGWDLSLHFSHSFFSISSLGRYTFLFYLFTMRFCLLHEALITLGVFFVCVQALGIPKEQYGYNTTIIFGGADFHKVIQMIYLFDSVTITKRLMQSCSRTDPHEGLAVVPEVENDVPRRHNQRRSQRPKLKRNLNRELSISRNPSRSPKVHPWPCHISKSLM